MGQFGNQKAECMKYDPYVKRYISLEDYIKECYGGLPSESLLEEEYNKLPDHPGSTGIIRTSFMELYEAMNETRTRTEKKEKQRIVDKIRDLCGRMKGGEWIVNDDDIDAIFSQIIDNL